MPEHTSERLVDIDLAALQVPVPQYVAGGLRYKLVALQQRAVALLAFDEEARFFNAVGGIEDKAEYARRLPVIELRYYCDLPKLSSLRCHEGEVAGIGQPFTCTKK